MTSFYARWAALIVIALILSGLTYQHYQQNLASVTPEWIVKNNSSPTPSIRLEGMVKSGSLSGNLDEGQAEFQLVGDSANVAVHYNGSPPENLRELKTLIVVGQWDPAQQVFRAREIVLVTNYGFVVSAYLVAMIPLILLVFSMSRKVTSLFQVIKESKLYEPQAEFHVDSR
ncbi:MAG: cytochrome c maturation protein CcmE [Nitrospirota bacterium]|nr:MAG: cytochrome c maturation protein CcmE [Nitrospirota bacterium]